MQIDFHHGATYIIARYAGWSYKETIPAKKYRVTIPPNSARIRHLCRLIERILNLMRYQHAHLP